MTRRNTLPSRRRSVRARPRLPRGPRPSSGGRRSPSRQLEEHVEQKVRAPGSPSVSPQEQELVLRASEKNLPDEPSRSSPSGTHTAFDRNKANTLSVKEAAFRLSKSEDTVYCWLRAGRLRGWQLGGLRCAVVVSEESVERALLGAEEIGGECRVARPR